MSTAAPALISARFKPGTFKSLLGVTGAQLVNWGSDQVKKACNKTPVLKTIHVLFSFNDHSFFTYHQDNDGKAALIVNLSPGEANFHVAGKDIAVYTGPGSAHLFSTKIFHRSGSATRRCIRVALFYDLADIIDVESVSDSKAGLSTVGCSTADVKPEVADGAASSSKPDKIGEVSASSEEPAAEAAETNGDGMENGETKIKASAEDGQDTFSKDKAAAEVVDAHQEPVVVKPEEAGSSSADPEPPNRTRKRRAS